MTSDAWISQREGQKMKWRNIPKKKNNSYRQVRWKRTTEEVREVDMECCWNKMVFLLSVSLSFWHTWIWRSVNPNLELEHSDSPLFTPLLFSYQPILASFLLYFTPYLLLIYPTFIFLNVTSSRNFSPETLNWARAHYIFVITTVKSALALANNYRPIRNLTLSWGWIMMIMMTFC